MDWTDQIKVDVSGMSGGESYYDFEDLYQAFKERFLEELKHETEE
jgi:hypothetical protein